MRLLTQFYVLQRPDWTSKAWATRFRTIILTVSEIICIRESVDSLCRDGTNTPYTQYKLKPFKSLQKKHLSFYRHLTFIFGGFYNQKDPQSFQKPKVETRKVAKLPNCSPSFFFSEATSKLAQMLTMILARKKCIFAREGPRHHIFITIKLNSKVIYSTLHLPAIKKLDAIFMVL